MRSAARVIALCSLVFLSVAATADSLIGKVVKVVDGDTLYVLDANYEQHKIRLAGIDAPERKQAYGLASRKHLASIVAGKQVAVEYQKRDRYGHIVGKVWVNGRNACLEQVKAAERGVARLHPCTRDTCTSDLQGWRKCKRIVGNNPCHVGRILTPREFSPPPQP